jgi:uncharacterized Zn finger protein (UPF0148 family)
MEKRNFDFECTYCGHQFSVPRVHDGHYACPVCKDKNFKKRDLRKRDIYGYGDEPEKEESTPSPDDHYDEYYY